MLYLGWPRILKQKLVALGFEGLKHDVALCLRDRTLSKVQDLTLENFQEVLSADGFSGLGLNIRGDPAEHH